MFLGNISRCILKYSIYTFSYANPPGIRFSSRWSHRRPSRVTLQTIPSSLEQEEIIDLDPQALKVVPENIKDKVQIEKRRKSDNTTSHSEVQFQPTEKLPDRDVSPNSERKVRVPPLIDGEKIKKRRAQAAIATDKGLSNELVFDEKGELIYQKLKENDGRVSNILTNLKSKNGRTRNDQVLVEGRRLIVDGLQAKCQLKYLIFSRSTDLDDIKAHLPNKGVKLYKIPYKDISLWSNVDTSSGLLGVFEMPKAENMSVYYNPLPLQIICDNVRDPGNLGAILRASVGVGCRKVLLMKGCVDLWEPKVIRSAAGAHFRLPIYNSLEWSEMYKLVKPTSSVIIADNNFKVQISSEIFQSDITEEPEAMAPLNLPIVPYYSVDYVDFDSVSLIVGGETEGISEDCYRFAAEHNGLRVNIPLQKGVDSLNTGMATAVIAFEIKKQILQARAAQKSVVQ